MAIVKVQKDLEDILPDFLNYRKEDIETLQNLINVNDFKKIQSIGHKLAGNAGGYGFNDLGEIGVLIEEAAQKQNLPEIIKLTADYKEYIDNVTIEFI